MGAFYIVKLSLATINLERIGVVFRVTWTELDVSHLVLHGSYSLTAEDAG